MQHPVHAHVALFHGKVDAVVIRPAAVQLRRAALQHAKPFGQGIAFQIRRLDVHGFEQLELDLRRQLRQLGGTDFVEDDLHHGEKGGVKPTLDRQSLPRKPLG